MAQEQFNYTYTENPYLQQAYAAETAAADAAAIAYQNQANAALAQAKQTQLQSAKGAAADYYANINPYGVQAEALGKSGLSQSNMIRGYADYTNRLGAAKDAYENASADIDTSVLSAKARAQAGKMMSKARYNSNLANDMRQDQSDKFDIWQDREDRQYRQGRDAVDDERYKREWAYNHRKAKKSTKSKKGSIDYTSFYDDNTEGIIRNIANSGDINAVASAAENEPNGIYREMYKTAYARMLQDKAEERKQTIR